MVPHRTKLRFLDRPQHALLQQCSRQTIRMFLSLVSLYGVCQSDRSNFTWNTYRKRATTRVDDPFDPSDAQNHWVKEKTFLVPARPS
ncbi:hypothetical protein GY45DRAFT_1096812 [Cubamyces sp. BRFM 1775]|nr:hypothetical protein GY45DRAFT_1096812 [Cubamyces sp. BRFM 1775]